jgi:hypothetical protein
MRRAQVDDDEESVLLLVTPKDDGTGENFQVISAMDGTSDPIREIMTAISECPSKNGNASASGFKPNNLSCLFTDTKGGNATIEIMDAVEFNGGIILTPQNVDHKNVSRVFRPSTDASSANLLPGSVVCDSEDEDETLYHDGCTIIHQVSTFGDNTIDTISSARAAAKRVVESMTESDVLKIGSEKVRPVDDNIMGIGTPTLSPDGPPLTRQAAMNGSFLFSPNNMGRADPIIRAKERALSNGDSAKPSITMLPSVKAKKGVNREGEIEALVIRQSYSHSSIETTEVVAVPAKKQVMSSLTEGREFPFHAILQKFSTDASLEDASSLNKGGDEYWETTPSSDEVAEMKTPLVTNPVIKKNYPKTPFPVTILKVATSEVSSPDIVVALNSGSSSQSTSASSSKKRLPAQDKTVPKSALKTRKGFVKDRVCDIQQRISEPDALRSSTISAVTDVNGRLKRNHSYRLKKTRRTTNGNGARAPHKAVLQTTYIRSVPIAIAKSYSRDSRDGKLALVEDVSFAAKYTSGLAVASSPNSDNAGSSTISDAASYVSETTDCDPFNSLLGKMMSDEESSSSEDEEEEVHKEVFQDKENSENVASPSAHLPFKATTLVKPTEINLREKQAPLSPVPMQPRAWREMAAKAALEKGHSARFRSEKSWREISH